MVLHQRNMIQRLISLEFILHKLMSTNYKGELFCRIGTHLKNASITKLLFVQQKVKQHKNFFILLTTLV